MAFSELGGALLIGLDCGQITTQLPDASLFPSCHDEDRCATTDLGDGIGDLKLSVSPFGGPQLPAETTPIVRFARALHFVHQGRRSPRRSRNAIPRSIMPEQEPKPFLPL